ncbi:MAG: WYL domain-containing protein, partial [Muribaculaceae bacterium]|nr:WYL domain-containing protein [Muribaculaceae bacterium]
VIPDDFDAETYFRDSFGVVFTQGEVKDIKLRVDARQAKYFRAVPLHHSQQEMIHDTFSIFSYRMKISPDFVEEILAHGSRVTVIQPVELKAMVISELRDSLSRYE